MTRSALTPLLAATAALALAAPLAAQERELAPRVDRLEKEMHAVQRKVFPGGAGQYLEAEIAPPPAQAAPDGIPATTPLVDLTARVDALEKEVARLTGQVEENGHAIRVLQDQATRDRAGLDARLKALELPAAPAAPPADAEPAPPKGKGKDKVPKSAAKSPPPETATAEPTVAAPPPSSGDPGEDAYMAGYKLWSDKQYPEAEAALKAAVAKYPKHRRASYAQNLLGRAYLDEGKPALAAEAFYANYQKMPKGERAPDSLYYLGVSLTQLKKPVEACKVYDELDSVYGATLSGALRTKAADGRAAAKCK